MVDEFLSSSALPKRNFTSYPFPLPPDLVSWYTKKGKSSVHSVADAQPKCTSYSEQVSKPPIIISFSPSSSHIHSPKSNRTRHLAWPLAPSSDDDVSLPEDLHLKRSRKDRLGFLRGGGLSGNNGVGRTGSLPFLLSGNPGSDTGTGTGAGGLCTSEPRRLSLRASWR